MRESDPRQNPNLSADIQRDSFPDTRAKSFPERETDRRTLTGVKSVERRSQNSGHGNRGQQTGDSKSLKHSRPTAQPPLKSQSVDEGPVKPETKKPKGPKTDGFVVYSSKEDQLKAINQDFEKRIVEEFRRVLLRFRSISISHLNTETTCLRKDDFHGFLQRVFPDLKNFVFSHSIERGKSLFMDKLYRREDYQIDGGFLIYRFKEKDEILDATIKVNETTIRLVNPSVLVIEVSTTDSLEEMTSKIYQVVINMLVSWFEIHKRLDSSDIIGDVFRNKMMDKTSSFNSKSPEQRLFGLAKQCLFVSNGSLESKAALFNEAYQVAKKDRLFCYFLRYVQCVHIELSEEQSQSQVLFNLFDERRRDRFKVQHIAFHECFHEEIRDVKDLICSKFNKLSHQMKNEIHASNESMKEYVKKEMQASNESMKRFVKKYIRRLFNRITTR